MKTLVLTLPVVWLYYC